MLTKYDLISEDFFTFKVQNVSLYRFKINFLNRMHNF